MAEEFNNNNYLKLDNMKKLAMILAITFTMGLAASTVSASVKDEPKKTETAATEKKEGCAKASECSKDKKACCSSEKKAETKTPAK